MTVAHVPVHKFDLMKIKTFKARTAQHTRHRTSLFIVYVESDTSTVYPSASELPCDSFYIFTFLHDGEGVRRVFGLERHCILVSHVFQDF